MRVKLEKMEKAKMRNFYAKSELASFRNEFLCGIAYRNLNFENGKNMNFEKLRENKKTRICQQRA